MHCHTVKQYTKLFYNALFFYKYVNYFDYSAEQCNIGAELFILQQVNVQHQQEFLTYMYRYLSEANLLTMHM